MRSHHVNLAAYALALLAAVVLSLHDKLPTWVLAGLLGVAVPQPWRAVRQALDAHE